MWIKWKYNDHGHPDFKEAEIPDDFDGESCVEDYICERGWVPTWSERFMAGRIKWKKIARPSKETLTKLIANRRDSIKYHQEKLDEYKKLMKQYYD
jgi:hypothetical protein